MSAWPLVRLGDIARPKQYPVLSRAEMTEAGYPVYGANGRIGFASTFTHTAPTILIGCRGSCGTVHITEPRSYANGNAMALDKIDLRKFDLEFLYYFFASRGFSDVTTGSSQPQIIGQNLVRVEIPAPPLAEQRRIAAILDQADALRAKRRAALAQLAEMAQAIFVEMFGDPRANPLGWTMKSLGDLGDLERGVSKHRPRNDPSLLDGPYPLIQTGDVANCDGYIRSYSSTYSETGLRQSRMWPDGTLCITIAANIGKTGILTFKSCFPDSVVGFTPGGLVCTEYVQTWMAFIQRKLEEDAPQSAQKNINLAILRDLRIPCPPRQLQDTFVARLRCVDRLKTSLREQSNKLDSLFASLQHRAFNGEL